MTTPKGNFIPRRIRTRVNRSNVIPAAEAEADWIKPSAEFLPSSPRRAEPPPIVRRRAASSSCRGNTNSKCFSHPASPPENHRHSISPTSKHSSRCLAGDMQTRQKRSDWCCRFNLAKGGRRRGGEAEEKVTLEYPAPRKRLHRRKRHKPPVKRRVNRSERGGEALLTGRRRG